MNSSLPAQSWFGPVPTEATEVAEDPQEFGRLWQAFMTARLTLGLVLMALQGALYATGTSHSRALVAITAIYFLGALATRLLAKPRPLGVTFNRAWGVLVGLDILVFSVLQLLQGSSINYTPLFALPILLTSVLGSLRLALGTAAGVTVLLLSATLWTYLQGTSDATPYFVQSALSGVGYFLIAFLSNQLSTRLASEGQRARQNQLAVNMQRQVNELVIDSLPEGVLIVDDSGGVRAANPAARQLLGSQHALRSVVFNLNDEAGWMPLLTLTQLTVGSGTGQEQDVSIDHVGHGPCRIHARTRLAAPLGVGGESLCVLFLQDQRELEARMRTEKLASMGRMSTAVAHEIRNPLAAIVQANALLEEDVDDPRLKKLTAMVDQNAKRLGKIVDDILRVSWLRSQPTFPNEDVLELCESARTVCVDWVAQNAKAQQISCNSHVQHLMVRFDADHLRRVLVNLLDNARRYANSEVDSIQVICSSDAERRPIMVVWSDSPPMDQSMERHLFEPFFSSESRSSGLGLFICRELCARHGATIVYQRTVRTVRGHHVHGNEFAITFVVSTPIDQNSMQEATALPWQTTLY
jgi:two-component system sensor histidine kinase PilS (NtrC family)